VGQVLDVQRARDLEERVFRAKMESMIPNISLILELTPSDASTGRDKQKCYRLLEMLRMGNMPSVGGEEYSSQYQTREFGFKWGDHQDELGGYPPLQRHLEEHGFGNTMVVGSGDRLPYTNLFDLQVFQLRSKLGAHGEQVVLMAKLCGRTDLVCCEEGQPVEGGLVFRWMVDFAIEVKTVESMRKNKQSCELEAMLQVIGLNISNQLKAPPVVLTNLAKTHSVLYLEITKEDPLTFAIMKRTCSTVLCACDLARKLSKEVSRRGIAHNFGRGPTPDASFEATYNVLHESNSSQGSGDVEEAQEG